MTHISVEDIYEIAYALKNGVKPDHKMQQMVSHIKACDTCFKLFSLSCSMINITEPLEEIKAPRVFAAFEVIKEGVSKKIALIQDFAKSANWGFGYQPEFAGARGRLDNDTKDRVVLQNAESKDSRIIIQDNNVFISIEDDGGNYAVEYTTADGDEDIVGFKYDEYEGMLVAEIKDISGELRSIRIIENE